MEARKGSPALYQFLSERAAQEHKERGTGRTTRIMAQAPRNATFVWHCNQLHYPKALSEKIGRKDLHIVGPSFFERQGYKGSRRHVVVDHAFDPRDFNDAIFYGWNECMTIYAYQPIEQKESKEPQHDQHA